MVLKLNILLIILELSLLSCKSPGKDKFGDFVLDKGGVLMWYNQPSGIYFEGKYKNTYLAWLDRDLNVKICSYDEANDKFSRFEILKKWQYPDDHGLPVIHLIKKGKHQGKILVLLNLHNSYLSIRRSLKREDVSEFEDEKIVDSSDITYPSILESGNGRLLLFYKKNVFDRAGIRTRNLMIRYSDNGGDSWSKEQEIISFGKDTWVYSIAPKVVKDTIHLVFSIKEAYTKRVINFYYLKSFDFGETWQDSKGVEKRIPVENLEPIIETPEGLETRVWDLNVTSKNIPRVSYVTYDISKCMNYISYLDCKSGNWISKLIGISKKVYYPTGIIFDSKDEDVIICSEVGNYNNLQIVEKKLFKGNFKVVKILSKNKSLDQIRPQLVENYSKVRIMWLESLNYNSFQDFNTNLKLEIR